MDFIMNDMSDQEVLMLPRKRRERAPKWKIRALKYEKADMEKVRQVFEKYPELQQTCSDYATLLRGISTRVGDIDSKLQYTYSKLKKYPARVHKIPSEELKSKDSN